MPMILDLTFSMVSLVTGVYVHTLSVLETVTSSKEVWLCARFLLLLGPVTGSAQSKPQPCGCRAVAAPRVWTQELGNLLPFVPISPSLIASASQDGLRNLLIS